MQQCYRQTDFDSVCRGSNPRGTTNHIDNQLVIRQN